jgi:hypothetical protein
MDSDYYLRTLWGGKMLAELNERRTYLPEDGNFDSISGDPGREYLLNSRGYRSLDLPNLADIVFGGCSFTFGTGISESDMWANVVADKLKYSRYIIAKPGIGVGQIVEEVFNYISDYGNPKILMCMFPNFDRVQVPIDGTVLKTPSGIEKSKNRSYHRISTNQKSYIETIHTKNFEGDRSKYLKAPYNAEFVISPDIATYQSVIAIRRLEQYCKAVGITLLWSTWDASQDQIIEKVISTNPDLMFDGYFSLKDYMGADTLGALIDGKATSLVCHNEVRISNQMKDFNRGSDNINGEFFAHPGSHANLHFAEAFLDQL